MTLPEPIFCYIACVEDCSTSPTPFLCALQCFFDCDVDLLLGAPSALSQAMVRRRMQRTPLRGGCACRGLRRDRARAWSPSIRRWPY